MFGGLNEGGAVVETLKSMALLRFDQAVLGFRKAEWLQVLTRDRRLGKQNSKSELICLSLSRLK